MKHLGLLRGDASSQRRLALITSLSEDVVRPSTANLLAFAVQQTTPVTTPTATPASTTTESSEPRTLSDAWDSIEGLDGSAALLSDAPEMEAMQATDGADEPETLDDFFARLASDDEE